MEISLEGVYTYSTGGGIYVDSSRYIDDEPISNNSLVVLSSYCQHCGSQALDIYCFSNATSASSRYYRFPDRHRYSTSQYNYEVSQQSYSGTRIHVCSAYNYYCHYPSIWGIFTCEIPDSEGNTIQTSVGIYSSMPSKFFCI